MMMTDLLAARLDRTIKAAGVPIFGVSIGKADDKTTWTVQPANLQGAAQATIDAFNPDDPALVTAEVEAQAQFTSRQKDILSMCALVVRSRNIAAWNALTIAQKQTATFAEADVWKAMRVWAETNL